MLRRSIAISKIIVLCGVGGLFPENSEELINAFQNAVRILNTSNDKLKLQAVTASVDTNDSFKVQKAGM